MALMVHALEDKSDGIEGTHYRDQLSHSCIIATPHGDLVESRQMNAQPREAYEEVLR